VELGGTAVFAGLRISGSYALLDSEVIRSISSSPIFAAGRSLYRRPRHSGSVQAGYTRGRVALGLGGVFVGSRVDTDFNFPTISSNAGYVVWHANGELQLPSRTAGFVVVENLANREYMEPLGYRGLGRTFRAGVRARF
jgi:outer membrane receptor protein involved in Fe transport